MADCTVSSPLFYASTKFAASAGMIIAARAKPPAALRQALLLGAEEFGPVSAEDLPASLRGQFTRLRTRLRCIDDGVAPTLRVISDGEVSALATLVVELHRAIEAELPAELRVFAGEGRS